MCPLFHQETLTWLDSIIYRQYIQLFQVGLGRKLQEWTGAWSFMYQQKNDSSGCHKEGENSKFSHDYFNGNGRVDRVHLNMSSFFSLSSM